MPTPRNPTTCPAILAAAVAYVLRRTTTWPLERVRMVRARPDVQCAEAAVEACCLEGDAEGLMAACRRYWASVLA